MKKNSKGFFLAETIVMVALVTTVMAFVYPNVSKIYDNYKNQVLYYDQTEDLFVLKAVYESKKGAIKDKIKTNKITAGESNPELNNKSNYTLDTNNLGIYLNPSDHTIESANGLEKLYIVGYMYTPIASKDFNIINDTYNFQRYLSRMKKTTYSPEDFRLIGKFCEKFDHNECAGNIRYASIRISKEDIESGE